MTNSISIYNFNNNQVRTANIDGEPWFCLADCCAALKIKQNRDTATRLSQKGVGKTDILTAGGKQEVTFINEPNLYRLIFRSNKPQAQAFADWVYSEVLPSIRKTGSYGAPSTVDMKAVGGLVKKCAAVAVRAELAKAFDDLVLRENIRSIVREAVRDEVADYLLKDGVKEGTFNSFPTADGLPAISWVMSISHGATALNARKRPLPCWRAGNAETGSRVHGLLPDFMGVALLILCLF